MNWNYKPLPAYIPPQVYDENYEKEKEKYTKEFILNNNCNKYMPHTEFKEYWQGLNNIRIKYGLGNLIQTECKCGGYGYTINEKDLEVLKEYDIFISKRKR